mmetsp:Transcript_126843/g.320385  ORF Transcript_126843/g.320385 Transcript_126843/m.320385 type:complete len:247 (+) Transcript_126843:127-867(+)
MKPWECPAPDASDDECCSDLEKVGEAAAACSGSLRTRGRRSSLGLLSGMAAATEYCLPSLDERATSSVASLGLGDFDLNVDLPKLAKSYSVGGCIVVLQVGDRVRVLARYGPDFGLKRRDCQFGLGFEFFRHHIARDLPIIITDARQIDCVRDHPLVVGYPGIVFYAAVPLIIGPYQYAGTLSIFDSQPRRDFDLEHCVALQRAARKVVEGIMRSCRCSRARAKSCRPSGFALRAAEDVTRDSFGY